METQENILVTIKQKLLAHNKQYEAVCKQNKQLIQALQAKNEALGKLETQVAALHTQLATMQLLQGNTTAAEKKELSNKIDNFIANINKTIHLLNATT